MKTALKITFGSILAASMIAPAYASDYSTFAHNIFTQSAIHADVIWGQATQNGLSFGDGISVQGSELGVRSANFVRPKGSYDWSAGYTYHFACTQTRLFFQYDRFRDGHHQASAENVINLFTTAFAPGFGTGRVHDRTDAYSLGLDRQIAFGSSYTIDTAFFLAWDKVARTFYQNTVGSPNPDTFVSVLNTYNRFRGFGPGVGLKGRLSPFDCCQNVGFFATFASTILYGKNRFHSVSTTDDASIYDLSSRNSKSLVNKFDISFGIDYKNVFKLDCEKMQFGVSLGLRYLNYINVFKNGNTSYNPGSPPPETAVALQANAQNTFQLNTGFPEDWGRFGPFLQFRIGGADA